MRRRYIDETGKRYGRWLVLRHSGEPTRQARWLCRCKCGTERVLDGGDLRRGVTRSCGCWTGELISERARKLVGPLNSNYRHGFGKHEGNKRHGLYRSWMSLRKRLSDPNYHGHHYYRDKQIQHDPRWLDFGMFCEDMGATWFQGAALHRKDSWGGYYADNCVWMSPQEHGRVHQQIRRRLRGQSTKTKSA